MPANRHHRRRASIAGGSLMGLLLIAMFVWFVRAMMATKTAKQGRQVQIVQIIRPPPPPPPPPDQPPPPPQKTDEPLPKDQPEPEPKNDEPPPAAALGLDTDGSAGGDAFGLAARRGGSDLLGGNGGAVFAWYTNRLKDAVVEHLSGDSRLGAKKFSVSVQVWIASDGRVTEIKLVTTTGNHDLDQRIEAALTSLTRIGDAPPLEMPQPVSLKIVSHS